MQVYVYSSVYIDSSTVCTMVLILKQSEETFQTDAQNADRQEVNLH